MSERFELLERVGRGGMGTVWRARDRETGATVALKILHEQFTDDPYFVERFAREVEVSQRIDSPHVVRTIGFGVRDGRPYMVMEYVEGPSLQGVLRERGAMPWSEAKGVIRQLAMGLQAVHGAGVVHRDVKPSNALIAPDGTVKLADFGIAKALDLTALTGASTTMGTPAYMAPEGAASAGADVYGLGCVAFELLTGRPPFTGESQAEIVVKHIRQDPDLDIVPLAARDIVGWMLRKDPAARPTATELLAALDGTQVPSATGRAGASLLSIRMAVLACSVAIGCVAVVGWILGGRGDEEHAGASGADAMASGATAAGVRAADSLSPTGTSAPAPPSASAEPGGPGGGGGNTPEPTATSAAPTPTLAATETPIRAATPTSTPTATPTTATPTATADTRAFAFEPNGGAYPVPGEIEICWKGTPIGARFFVTIEQTAPVTGPEWSNEYVATQFTTCRFVPVLARDGPDVRYHAIARNDAGAVVGELNYAFRTYPLPTAATPPEILFVEGPASARLGESAIFRVRWRDADGNALTVTLDVEEAVRVGTEEPLHESRAVGHLTPDEQRAGANSAFGLICESVDPEPHRLVITVTDSAGLTAVRALSFACRA